MTSPQGFTHGANDTLEKRAIFSESAERAVLGAILVDRHYADDVRDLLRPEDFYLLRHKYILEAVYGLRDHDQIVDLITVNQELKRMGKFDDAGGSNYLAELLGAAINISGVKAHAQLVADYALRRRIGEMAARLMRDIENPKIATEDLRDRVESGARDLAAGTIEDEPLDMVKGVGGYFDRVEATAGLPGGVAGLATGFVDYDEKTDGLRGLMILAGRPGMGKCLGRGTQVMLINGETKAVEDIQPKDVLMGPDGKPRHITALSQGYGMLYRVTPTKGMAYVVNENHVLSLKMSMNAGYYKKGEVVNLSVLDYLAKSGKFKAKAKGWRAQLNFCERAVPLPPYLFGVWLGDGVSAKPGVTTMEAEIVHEIEAYATENGLSIRQEWNGSKARSYYVTGGKGHGKNPMTQALIALNVRGNKHIPEVYRLNSRAVRLEVLAGIIDTDGYLVSGCYEVICKSEQLATDIEWLARSLGMAAYKHCSVKTIRSSGFAGSYWRLFISGDISQIPVRLGRKRAAARSMNKDVTKVGVRVECEGEGDYFGFEVDGDHLFLLGDFTVTHNSALAANIALNVAKTRPVYFLSMEMDADEIYARFFAIVGDIGTTAQRRGLRPGGMSAPQWSRFVKVTGELSKYPIFLDAKGTVKLPWLRRRVERLMRKQPDLGLVVVDYLQLMVSEGKNSNRQEEVSRIARGLKNLSMDTGVPVLALSQLNRAPEMRANKRPTPADLRESGELEQAADGVTFIYRDIVYYPDTLFPNSAELIIAKQRAGATGTVTLHFDASRTLFRNAVKGEIDLNRFGSANGWSGGSDDNQRGTHSFIARSTGALEDADS